MRVLGHRRAGGVFVSAWQLRVNAAYAEANSLRFDLYVREGTTLSGPLQSAIDAPRSVINLIPALP